MMVSKKQVSGTAIGTKFAPHYACIFMDEIEIKSLQSQTLQTLYGLDAPMTFSLFGLIAKQTWNVLRRS